MPVRTIVHVGLLTAISVVLTRTLSLMVPIGGAIGLRLSIGEVPIYLAGILFGPLAGGVTGAAADLIGVSIAGIDFFPGFTISALLAGLVPGVLLHRRRDTLTFRQIVIVIIIAGFMVTALNTVWVNLLYGQALVVLLPPRILSRLLMIPIHSGLVWIVIRRFRMISQSQG